MPAKHKSSDRDWAKELKDQGLRVSKPRLAILGVLEKASCGLSAEEIFHALPKASCDLATVYRSLQTLEEIRILEKFELGLGRARYEIRHRDEHHHHHIICRQCKKIESLDLCYIPPKTSRRMAKGYREVSHQLEFYGLCPEC